MSGPDRAEEPAAEADAEGEGEEEAKEEGEEEPKPKKVEVQTTGEDTYDPIAAVVRLKIPKVPREPEMDDEGNEIVVEVDESELEDIPFDDKCLQINTKLEDQRIWVINHMASKTLRQEISAEFRQTKDRLDDLDTQDFNFRLEKEAAAFEEAFLELLKDVPENEVKGPKVPVFDFRPKY